MDELSPYKLFPEYLREPNFFNAPQAHSTRANLFTDHMDMTVPAKLFIYVNPLALDIGRLFTTTVCSLILLFRL